MFTASALNAGVLADDTKAKDSPMIVFPVPKSEKNLESACVFPDGGSKDIGESTPKQDDKSDEGSATGAGAIVSAVE